MRRVLEVQRLPNGNTLIADGADWDRQESKVVEVDPAGAVVWWWCCGDFIHSAQRLPNGNTLIADTNHNRIIEVNREGTIVWNSAVLADEHPGLRLYYPNHAADLDNGNLLISDRNNSRVLEVTRTGDIVWQYDRLTRQHHPRRLPNGNTMIANSDENEVIEVSPQGEIVWRYGGKGVLNWPRDAQRLENEHTLITDSRNARIIEITPEGQIVWQLDLPRGTPYQANRLPNGNTLIGAGPEARALEVDSSKRIVWEFRSLAWDYPAQLQNGDVEGEGGWQRGDLQANGELHPGLPYRIEVDAFEAHSGSRSLLITLPRSVASASIFWYQRTRAFPGARYELGGYLSTRGVEGGKARLSIVALSDLGTVLQEIVAGELQGSSNWTYLPVAFTSPAGTRWLEVRITLLGSGSVWSDDIVLRP